MVIKIDMLRCFAIVAQSGTLTDAAEKMGRTPSALSMTLKQLQDHLGVPLFESERKSKLTALGSFTLEAALRELDHYERTINAIEDFAKARTGFVRLAVVPSIAETFLPKLIRGFLEGHPNVGVEIRDMDSAAVLRELEHERVDLGIASGTDATAEIVREELFSDEFGIVCSTDHPLACSSHSLSFGDLKSLNFIANGLCAQIPDKALQAALKASPLMVRNTTSLLALVRNHMGVTVLPRLAIEPDNRQITFLPVRGNKVHRRIDILHHIHTSKSPAVTCFQEAIRKTAHQIALGKQTV